MEFIAQEVETIIQEVGQEIVQEIVQVVEKQFQPDIQEVPMQAITQVAVAAPAQDSAQVADAAQIVDAAQVAVAPQKIDLIHYKSPISMIFTVCGKVSHNLGKTTTTVKKSNIISIVHSVMEAIETVDMAKELKGQQKKDLAIDCLNWFVDQQEDLVGEDKAIIHESIELIAPDAIDVMAVVDSKNVKVKISDPAAETQKIALVHYMSPVSMIFTVCGKVSHSLGETTVKKSNILSIVHAVMEAIETVEMAKELKGQQKKDLAIDCLNWFVDQQEDIAGEDKEFIHESISLIVPDSIDVMAKIGNAASSLVKKGVQQCCVIG